MYTSGGRLAYSRIVSVVQPPPLWCFGRTQPEKYLSVASLAALGVQVMGLPADDLCLENAVVLERFSHRFPLVVDPAGQATRFLLNKYKVRHETTVLLVAYPNKRHSLKHRRSWYYKRNARSDRSLLQSLALFDPCKRISTGLFGFGFHLPPPVACKLFIET